MERYSEVWRYLHAAGVIYPCRQSRKDVAIALTAPHDEPAEPVFPVSLRPALRTGSDATSPQGVNWRFRVPDGEVIRFTDLRFGDVARTAGTDFGDFLVWRKDGFPAYELAVVADDHAMQISEVVRGEDLLTSTARQLLIYRALAWTAPDFYHCELMRDASGKRLAKRDGADALRTLRLAGVSPESLIANWSGQLLRGGLFEPGLHDPTDLGE
jgi:glutamyl-tRNA synthetase